MGDFKYWIPTINHISYNVILPLCVSVGLVVNIVAFCVWMFGPKSKSMCCAFYFAANAAVDFLYLTKSLFWFRCWQFVIYIPQTKFTCKLVTSLYGSLAHLSTGISAIITIERSLTILFPIIFQPQSMRKRSKIVISVITALQPFTQFIVLYYRRSGSNKKGFSVLF